MTAKDLHVITQVCQDDPEYLPALIAIQRIVDARKAFNQLLKEMIVCPKSIQN